MKLRTHYMIAGIAADKTGFTPARKLIFCIGSVLPDVSPTRFVNRHFYQLSGDYVFGNLERLAGKSSLYSVLRYGMMAHYVSDFCCHVHLDGKMGNALDHMRYEKNLNRYITKNYSNIKTETRLPFKSKDLHSIIRSYMHEKKASPNKDIIYALQACCLICEMAESGALLRKKAEIQSV